MKQFLFLLFCFFNLSGQCQFESFEKNGKLGFSHNGTVLKKAKYDSLMIDDPQIVTAYRKSKVYYFNPDGQKIYRTKLGYAEPFLKGTGIVKNKKGEFGILQKTGDFLLEFTLCEQPIRYESFIAVTQGYDRKKSLYNSNKLVEIGIDSVAILEGWLVTTVITEVPHIHRKKGIFGRNKSTTTYTYLKRIKAYELETTDLIEKEVTHLQPYFDHYLFYHEDESFSIRSTTSTDFQQGLTHLQTVDSNYFAASQKNEKHLFRNGDLKKVVSGDYDLFLPQKSTIYALKDTLEKEPALSIYDYNGNLIKKEINLIHDLEDGRFVFGKDSLCYIGNETGKQLSAFYKGIGAEKNGYRAVYGEFTYGYINDNTYEKITGDWPVIGRKRSSYHTRRRRRSFLKSVVTGVINTVRLFTRRPPISNYTVSNYDPNAINIVEDANGFHEGYAIVCRYGLNQDNTYDSLTMIENTYDLTYNYIDTAGNYLSDVEYDDCSPFMNGYAWVRKGKYTYLINPQEKKQKCYKFSTVERDEMGYFKVSYNGNYGVVDPDYKQVVPCKHSYLTYLKGRYTENKFGEETLIYQIPEQD